MSGFLFRRRPAPSETPAALEDCRSASAAILKVQAITASAIFALLVSKGVVSADEAADYMKEIGSAWARDVGGEIGANAGLMLESYGQALVDAGS